MYNCNCYMKKYRILAYIHAHVLYFVSQKIALHYD